MTINQRLKEFIEIQKIDAPEFYKKLGASRTEWSGWINSGKAITVNKLQLILNNAPTLNARWLLTGEGEMLMEGTAGNDPYKSNEKPLVINDVYKTRCALCEAKDKIILAYEDNIRLQKEKIDRYEGNGKVRSG